MKAIIITAFLLFSVISALNSQQKAFNMTTTSTRGAYFSMALAAEAESTIIQIDWGDGKPIDYKLGTSPQEIIGSPAGENMQVYGKGISYLNVNSKNLTKLDVKTASDLTELYCSSNSLSELDVSNLTGLIILNCSSNKIAELNVKNSRGLKAIFCSSNLLTALDLTKNPVLEQLYCSSNKLTTLDISNNLLLSNFNCSSNSIDKLDISLNTALTYFWCNTNLLSEIDISNNTLLSNFNCSSNNINKIDVSKNTALQYFSCSSNKLTFSTLPLMQSTWHTYTYSPQQSVEIAKTLYTPGENIDLSALLTSSISNVLPVANTIFSWKTSSGSELISGVDYEESNGNFKFLTIPYEDIYCQMTNSSFQNLVLKTEKITISAVTQMLNTFTSLKVYPNPFKKFISIESQEKIQKIELYTLSGKLLLEEKINNNKSASVNLSNIPKGLFLIKIYGETKNSLNKIFKE